MTDPDINLRQPTESFWLQISVHMFLSNGWRPMRSDEIEKLNLPEKKKMNEPFEQWVWVERGPDGHEIMITAQMPAFPNLGMVPLVHGNEDIARNHFGPIAVQHGLSIGRAVRLVRMTVR
jgi:hypothetical protein